MFAVHGILRTTIALSGLLIRSEQQLFGFFVICEDCSSLVSQAYRAGTL